MTMTKNEHRAHLEALRISIAEGDWSAPGHLSEASKDLWRSVVPERVRSPEKRFALAVALEARDELSRIHAELMEADLVSVTKRSGARHASPLLQHAMSLRKDFFKIWAALRLTHCGPIDSPPWQLIQHPDEALSGASVGY